MSLRYYAAIASGKASRLLLRLSGSGATAFPGLITSRIAPASLQRLARQCSQGVILVCGTNGKTTTCRLTALALTENPHALVHNKGGSNLTRGHLAAFLEKSNWLGRVRAEQALLEVDEAVLPETLRLTRPRILLLHNLFRDQLDRYGEIDSIVKKWQTAIRHHLPPESVLIVNADDPNLAFLARNSGHPQVIYYGLEDEGSGSPQATSAVDAFLSPLSGEPLDYSRYYLSHLGHYRDRSGGFTRPVPQVTARDISFTGSESTSFTLNYALPGQSDAPPLGVRIDLPMPGIYNVYNALAAASIAIASSVDISILPERFARLEGVFGRFETIAIAGRPVTFCLIKNPAGTSEVLRTLIATLPPDSSPLTLSLIANDNFADGTDVSWYWDCAFELVATRPAYLICSGNRAHDLALRLKYAGYQGPQAIIPDPAAALRHLTELPTFATGRHYVLSTYTATLEVQKIVRRRGWKHSHWNR
jgi:UDP-N-acetylmuramyl tripeptide synthase